MPELVRYLVYLALLLLLWRYGLWFPRSLSGIRAKRPLLLGHRGVRELKPENTLEAFEYAFEAGLDGAEFDVLKTLDDELILFHDFKLNGKHIGKYTYRELLDVDPKIPKLEELFDLAKAYPERLLNLEIKSDTLKTDGIEAAVVRVIKQSGLEDRVIVSSFNPMSLVRVRLRAPHLRTGLLFSPDMSAVLRNGFLAGWLHVDALHPYETQVDTAFMKNATRHGLYVNTWTVNDKKRITSLYALGVSAIIGDDPAVLRHLED